MAPRNGALGGARATVTPLIRLVPTKGAGFAWGLNWFETRIDLEKIGGPAAEGALYIRPLMAGVSYTFGGRGTLISISTVGGYAVNTLRVAEDTRRGAGDVSLSHSEVVRPGFGVWHSVHKHFGLSFFGGYVYARPTLTVDGVERKLKADYAVFSTGAAVVF